MPFMTPLHSKLARMALELRVREVAIGSGLGKATIDRFEMEGVIKEPNLQVLSDFYNSLNIQFVFEDDDRGFGVRLLPI